MQWYIHVNQYVLHYSGIAEFLIRLQLHRLIWAFGLFVWAEVQHHCQQPLSHAMMSGREDGKLRHFLCVSLLQYHVPDNMTGYYTCCIILTLVWPFLALLPNAEGQQTKLLVLIVQSFGYASAVDWPYNLQIRRQVLYQLSLSDRSWAFAVCICPKAQFHIVIYFQCWASYQYCLILRRLIWLKMYMNQWRNRKQRWVDDLFHPPHSTLSYPTQPL